MIVGKQKNKYQGGPFDPDNLTHARKAACSASVATLGLRICWGHPGGAMGVPMGDFLPSGGRCKACNSTQAKAYHAKPFDPENISKPKKSECNDSVAVLGLRICWLHPGGAIGLPLGEFRNACASCNVCADAKGKARREAKPEQYKAMAAAWGASEHGKKKKRASDKKRRSCPVFRERQYAQARTRHAENPELSRASQKKYRDKMTPEQTERQRQKARERAPSYAERRRELGRVWTEANPGVKAEQARVRRAADPEKAQRMEKEKRARRDPVKVREVENKYRNERYANDPIYRQSKGIRSRMWANERLRRKLHAKGISLTEIIERTGVAVFWHEAGLASAKAKGLVHFDRDHIVPLDLLVFLGYTSPEVLFHPENCEAMVPSDNGTKSNKVCAKGLALFKKFRPDILDVFFQWGDDYGWHGPRPDEEVA